MILAQITDTHVALPGSDIIKTSDTTGCLMRAVDHLNSLTNRPDAALITGDVVDSGAVAEYEIVKELCDKLEMPYFLIPGNHDDRTNMRSVFKDHTYMGTDGYMQYSLDDWPVRVLMLDTNIPGESGGILCEERLQWLDSELSKQPSKPTIVCLHHPPFNTGLIKMDKMGLENKQAFGEIIQKYSNVERVLSGHIHRPIQRRFYGTIAQICPSTAHQIELSLNNETRLASCQEPPACLLHYWNDAEGLVTHTSYIGEYKVIWELKESGI